jgi:hypothetical protein
MKSKDLDRKNKHSLDKDIDKMFGIPPARVKKDPDEFKGYVFEPHRNKYRVQFTYKKTVYRFGRYDTAEEAHSVYLAERAKKVAEWEKTNR